MKRTYIVIVIMVLLVSSLFSQYIDWGYFDFRFFISPDEVRQIISDKKMAADPSKIIESTKEMYYSFYLKPSFVYYDEINRKYYTLLFTDKFEEVKKEFKNKIWHLTRNDKKTFKILTLPKGASEVNKGWKYEYIFHKDKLFAIVLSFVGDRTKGDLDIMEDYFFNRCIEKITTKYGTPTKRKLMQFDSMTSLNFITYIDIFSKKVVDKDIVMKNEINVSYAKYGGKIANFQVTYVNAYFVDMAIKRFTNGDYEDVGSEGDLIQF
ncbi:hypothetical protein ACFL6D_01260 [Spirochaetota bacterium]